MNPVGPLPAYNELLPTRGGTTCDGAGAAKGNPFVLSHSGTEQALCSIIYKMERPPEPREQAIFHPEHGIS